MSSIPGDSGPTAQAEPDRLAGVGAKPEEQQSEEADEPWCEACRSWHPVPRDAEHHAALMCFAPLPPSCENGGYSERRMNQQFRDDLTAMTEYVGRVDEAVGGFNNSLRLLDEALDGASPEVLAYTAEHCRAEFAAASRRLRVTDDLLNRILARLPKDGDQ